ncbi:hypothetical protein RCL1_007819 [Eukaryota sp. TZLM3-RCL]
MPPKRKTKLPDTDSEDEIPLSELTRRAVEGTKRRSSTKSSGTPATKKSRSSQSDEEAPPTTSKRSKKVKSEDEPVPSKRKSRSESKSKTPSKVKKEEEDDEQPTSPPPRSRRSKKDPEPGDSDDEDNAADNEDDSVKWTNLEHNGVIFPPLYVPHGVPLLYGPRKIEIILPPDAEEWATQYAAVLGTPWATREVFSTNFWNCWQPLLRGTGINRFDQCDFTLIKNHLEAVREAKRQKTREEKAEEKRIKEEEKELYGYAIIDGRREAIGNYRVEPPTLFKGRGAHPRSGMFKARITPKDVTINIGEGAKVPRPGPPYEGQTYGAIVHNHTKEYLAFWTDTNFNITKYVRLGATSQWKGQSDLEKFEIARQLASKIGNFRRDYWNLIRSESKRDQQIGVVLYLIDHFAFRVGHQKGDETADTVGCCSLRKDHIELTRRKRWWRQRGPRTARVNISEQYSELIQSDNEDALRENPQLRAQLGSLCGIDVPLLPPQGTCPKYDFSEDEEEQDDEAPRSTVGGDALMGYSGYERASDPDESDDEGRDGVWPYYVVFDFLGKDSVRFFQRRRIHQLVWYRLQSFQRESEGDLFDAINPSVVNDSLRQITQIDGISGKSIRTYNASGTLARLLPRHSINLHAPDKMTQLVAFFNECNKKVAILCNHQRAVAKTFDQQVVSLEEKIRIARLKVQYLKLELIAIQNGDDLPDLPRELKPKPPKKKIKQEEEDKKDEDEDEEEERRSRARKRRSEQVILKAIERAELAVTRLLSQLNMKQSLKTVSLSTSKTNYIDPRIVISFCKKYDVPLAKFYTKSLVQRFTWADVESDWQYLQ